MPRTDPADGRSLWVNDGFICMASGDVSQSGAISPFTLIRVFKEVLKMFPI